MGNYTNKNLVLNEMVVFETNYHWSYYINLVSVISFGLWPNLHFKCTEFVITNLRVILKTGILSIKSFEINLSKIETVKIEQTLMGRIFNYGNVIIIGSGGTVERIENINHPIEFRNCFMHTAY